MAEKVTKEAKPEKVKVIMSLEDCFKQPELDGGEEKRKLWNFYREESDEDAIIRRCKRDAYEHQSKYLMCAQGVLYALSMNLGIGNNEVYKAGSYVCGGMGGTGICGALVGARMALGVAYGRSNMYDAGWPREVGETHLWNTLPVANDELNSKFEEHFGSIHCHQIQEKYFGRHFFIGSDYEDPKVFEMHENGLLYRIVSTYAANICEWTAGVTAEIILREWRKLGIPIKMPFR
jgi:C_GCAxxG_C_C family probable redox protein